MKLTVSRIRVEAERGRGGACLAARYAFVLERSGESRCVSVHGDNEGL